MIRRLNDQSVDLGKKVMVVVTFMSIFFMVSQTTAQDRTPNFLTPETERSYHRIHLVDMPGHTPVVNNTSNEDSNITFLGRWGWGPCDAVGVQGNYAYIGNGVLLQVLDISDPTDPQIVSETLFHSISDIDNSGDYTYLVGNHTLTIIDVSTPTTPTVVGDLEVPTVAGVTVSEGYAYLGDFPGLLHIVDVSDPTEPQEVSTQAVTGEMVIGIGIYQHYAYVSTGDGMVMDIIDVSDPNNPHYEGYYVTGGWGSDIAVDGHYLYLGSSASPQFRILDITDPVNPEHVGGLETRNYSLPISIKVVDNYAYVSLYEDGLSIIDVSDVTAPEEVSFVNWIRPNYIFPGNLVVDVNLIYVAAFTGLWVIDASSPEEPLEACFFPTGQSAQKIAEAESIAYVADGYAGLWAVDVDDPANPQNIGHLATSGFLSDVSVVGDYAYLLQLMGSIRIVDISNPSDPTQVSRLNINGNALTVSGGHAFVTVRDSGLIIVNVSEPANPYRVGFCPLSGYPEDVAVWDDYAYVGTFSDGLRIIDVSEPDNPLEVSSIFEGAAAARVVVQESLAYVPKSGKLKVLDVSIPTQPSVIGSLDSLFYKYPTDITVSEDYVYMSVSAGIQIIDVSSPEDPVLAAYYRLGAGKGVTARGAHIYWSVGSSGFIILQNQLAIAVYEQLDQNASFVSTLYQNHPNPFNLRTMIEYSLPQDSPVKLVIYNVTGQKVAVLVDGFQNRGNHEVDFSSDVLPSGVYFYRLQAGDFIQTKKMLLVR